MDKLTPENRSENMRRIRGKNTVPELTVRKLCREIGFSGYRIHRKDLPGKPDLAWVGQRRVVFVNGCFWHGHECTEGSRKPRSNQSYWIQKIQRNKQRDADNIATLRASGWSVLTVWECETNKQEKLSKKLKRFLSPKTPNNAFNTDASKRRAS